MQRSLCVLILAINAAVSTGSPSLGQAPPQASPGATSVTSERELRSLSVESASRENVGKVKSGERVERRVIFQNRLNTPVEVEVVSKSCGCLQSDFSSTTVRPGERTTFTLATASVPSPSVQAYQATFRAKWSEDGEARSEIGACVLRYSCSVPFVIRPEAACVFGISGRTASQDFFVRMLSTEDGEPMLDAPTCTIPGWSIQELEKVPSAPSVLHFRASGPARAAGVSDGEVFWRVPGADEPVVKTPIRLTTVPLYRIEHGGFVFLPENGDEALKRDSRLFPRAESPTPVAAAKLVVPSEWITVRLASRDTIEATLTPGLGMPVLGSVRACVVSEDGSVLLDFPIVWCMRGVRTSPP